MTSNVQNKPFDPKAAQAGASQAPSAQAQAAAQQVKDALWRASQNTPWGGQFQAAINNAYLSENLARGSAILPAQAGPDPFAGLSANDLAQAKATITQAVQGLSLGSEALAALTSAGLVPGAEDSGQQSTAGSGAASTPGAAGGTGSAGSSSSAASTSGSIGSGTAGTGGATSVSSSSSAVGATPSSSSSAVGATPSSSSSSAVGTTSVSLSNSAVGATPSSSSSAVGATPSSSSSAAGATFSSSSSSAAGATSLSSSSSAAGATSSSSSSSAVGATSSSSSSSLAGATPTAAVTATRSAAAGSTGDVKELLTAVLNGQPGASSGRSLAGPEHLASWTDAQYSQLQQGIATAQQFYPQLAPADLAKLVVAEGAQESSGDYKMNVAGAKPGDGQGFMQVTSQSVIQDFRNYGTAIKAPDGSTVVDPKGKIDPANVAQNVALWAWYTHNAVATGQSLDQEMTWSPGNGDKANQDFGNAQLKWFAGPSNDRHTSGGAAAYDDYGKRVSDYFVQSGFGTAADYQALINTPLTGSTLLNVQKNAKPTRDSTYDDTHNPYNTGGGSAS